MSEIKFPENCPKPEAKELLHVEYLRLNCLIDLEFKEHRKETLAADTSIEQDMKEVEVKVSAKAHGTAKYTGLAKAPPDLKSSRAGFQKAALLYYKKVVNVEAKSKAFKEERAVTK